MEKFGIEGMTCQRCVAKVSAALQQAGYSDAEVTLKPPLVKLPSSSASSDEIQKVVSQAGAYKIVKAHEEPSASHVVHDDGVSEEKLTPLFVILAYIAGGVLLRAWIADDYSFTSLMTNFMGGFFIVFSLFKFLNLAGFAEAYATYDIIASRSRSYALSYPFIELLLGVAYFAGFAPLATNLITFVLMAVGSVGVFQALREKRSIQCACLGTALKLPMTKVTLVEDVTMGLMALVMIIHQVQL